MTTSRSVRIALILGALPLSAGACSTGHAGTSDAGTFDGGASDGRIDAGHETIDDGGDCFAGHVTNGGACASDEECCAVVSMGPVECVKGTGAAMGTCRAGAGGACSNDSACATDVCADGQCESSKLGGACGSGIDCSGLGAMCLGGRCGTFGGDAGVTPRDAAGVPPADASSRDAGSADATSTDARGADAAPEDASRDGAGDSAMRMSDGSAG